MNVAFEDLSINQGSTYSFELVIFEDDLQTQPADLTGFSARGQIRKQYSSPNVAATFGISIGSITTLDGFPEGLNAITLNLTSEQTDSLTEHDYVYDIEIFKQEDSNGPELVLRVLEGKIYVYPSVTH